MISFEVHRDLFMHTYYWDEKREQNKTCFKKILFNLSNEKRDESCLSEVD